MPSSTAARVACSASSTRAFFSFISASVAAPTAKTDPLFGGFPSPETVFHWHGETFDLPEGAQLLAYSDACRRQAFRIAGNVYGLQFHLEVTPEMIQDWCRHDETCGAAREMEAPIDPHANTSRLAEVAATVFDRWCGLFDTRA